MVHTETSEWRWLWQEVTPFVRYQAVSLLCILSGSFVSLAHPLIMKWLIDDLLPSKAWHLLPLATGLFFAIYVGNVALSSVGTRVAFFGVQRLKFSLRRRLLAHMQTLSATFYGQRPVGDLVQRLERDVDQVGEFGNEFIPTLVRMAITTVFTVVTMVWLDWRLTCLVLPLLPLFVIVRERFRPLLRDSADTARAASGHQSSLLNEILTGAMQIQLLGAEARMERRYVRLNLRTMRALADQQRHQIWFSLLSMAIIAADMALVIGVGSARVMSGALSTGSLVAFYSYISFLFSPLTIAVGLYARLNQVRASLARLREIERTPLVIADAPDAVALTATPRELAGTGLGFAYDEENGSALEDVSFSARAGERVAILGASGCGKSTLLKLVARLYDPRDGRILVDGQDIRALHVRSLRRAISFVPQDPVLWQGTLRDNLLHAQPTATRADLDRVARLACLTDVLDRLPAGWDTELGPMGAGLSGGERQRVAIARALLQNRPIVIFDEATSALDVFTERQLLARIERWCSERIVVMVTHRLSAAGWANRLLVLDRGLLVEQGTHDTLFHPGTRYFELWQREPDTLPDGDRSDDALGVVPIGGAVGAGSLGHASVGAPAVAARPS